MLNTRDLEFHTFWPSLITYDTASMLTILLLSDSMCVREGIPMVCVHNDWHTIRHSPWLWLVVLIGAWLILAHDIRNTRWSQGSYRLSVSCTTVRFSGGHCLYGLPTADLTGTSEKIGEWDPHNQTLIFLFRTLYLDIIGFDSSFSNIVSSWLFRILRPTKTWCIYT